MYHSFLAAANDIDIRVSVSTDDAEESGSGSVCLNSSDLELVCDRNSNQTVGMRFTNVGFSFGATIDIACIQFNVDEYKQSLAVWSFAVN